MFNWLKRRAAARKEALAQFEKTLGPMALAAALQQSLTEYLGRVHSGKVSVPAYKRKEPYVVSIWTDTRNEVFTQLLGNGSDLSVLGDVRQQRKILEEFITRRPHLEFPQHPNGDPLHDTIQAISRAYLYISEVGKAVGDQHTDLTAPSNSKKYHLSDFEEYASTLRARWIEFHAQLSGNESLPAQPSTVLEFLYEDITHKTKSIAFCAAFGPSPETGLRNFQEMLRASMLKNGDSSATIEQTLDQLRAGMERFRAAHNPDEATLPGP